MMEFHDRGRHCAAGLCPHAGSPRVPCRCPDCDETTREMVAGYRAEAEARIAAAPPPATPKQRRLRRDRTGESEGDD